MEEEEAPLIDSVGGGELNAKQFADPTDFQSF